ncbi:unnamed protein product [Rotaria magnacalcarata]|uniref:Uncharacterized protein n=1 Tax=Rotaria magnacalcarata TaxID=392030 RepID=A0A8S2W466_9BILA|nr:unnamed protein product [Rotaria magnacalcarata]
MENTDIISDHAQILDCKPITSLDHFQQDMLGSIDLVEEKLRLITSVAHPDHPVSMLLRSSNKLELEQAARSVHDALFVIWYFVIERFVLISNILEENIVQSILVPMSAIRLATKQFD